MFSPAKESLPEPEAAKLARFFGSDERKLLERLIRSMAANELAESGNLLSESPKVFLAEGKIDGKLEARCRKICDYAIALEVIAEMESLISVKENLSHAVVTPNIRVI